MKQTRDEHLDMKLRGCNRTEWLVNTMIFIQICYWFCQENTNSINQQLNNTDRYEVYERFESLKDLPCESRDLLRESRDLPRESRDLPRESRECVEVLLRKKAIVFTIGGQLTIMHCAHICTMQSATTMHKFQGRRSSCIEKKMIL